MKNMDIFGYELVICLIALLPSICIIYIVKTHVLENKVHQIISDFLDEVTTNTELQKRVYIIGALVGNGIKSGIGFKSSGKMKLEDIIINAIAGKFLPSYGENKEQKDDTLHI